MNPIAFVTLALVHVASGGVAYGGVAYGGYGYGTGALGYGYGSGALVNGGYGAPLANRIPTPYHTYDHQKILTCKSEGSGQGLSVNIKYRKPTHVANLDGHYENGAGLEATVNTKLAGAAKKVSVILTEKFRSDCKMAGMKDVSYPKNCHENPAYGYLKGQQYGFDEADHDEDFVGIARPGVLYEVETSGKASHLVERLAGWTRIEEIAGMGVQVCPTENLKKYHNGHFECIDDSNPAAKGVICCALHYADEEQFLS